MEGFDILLFWKMGEMVGGMGRKEGRREGGKEGKREISGSLDARHHVAAPRYQDESGIFITIADILVRARSPSNCTNRGGEGGSGPDPVSDDDDFFLPHICNSLAIWQA